MAPPTLWPSFRMKRMSLMYVPGELLMRWSGAAPKVPRSAKRLSDGGHDKAERGEPTHSLDQQLRHAAVFPCCQRWRLIRGRERKEPVSKKSTAVLLLAPAWYEKGASGHFVA